MKDARGNNKKKKPHSSSGTRMRKLLDEMDSKESDNRAEAILKLIKSRRLPTLEDTLSEAQHKRLKPLAWLIQNQSYTAQEIMMVATINEQRLQHLVAGDQEYSRQRANRTKTKGEK